jgi:UDP-3-O-[3-hydroxymyristoyl] glucosamine N-acyltransferase
MKINVTEILSFLTAQKYEYEFIGDSSQVLLGFCPISALMPGSVTWIRCVDEFDLSIITKPSELLLVVDKSPDDSDVSGFNLIITDNPRVVYFEILGRFFPPVRCSPGVAPTAVVETEKIGNNVSFGHNCYICKDVTIGHNVTIKNNVVIECPAVIGNDCIIESGAVIGASGYGYYTSGDRRPRKVPDYGGVIIGDRVSIGANTCIVRGTLADTVIEDDVKIDNLCHIAHNARIGARSYIIALSMVAGSSVIEEDVYIAPGAMIIDQISVGKNSMVGMGAIVAKSVEPNKIVVATPARVVKENTQEER